MYFLPIEIDVVSCVYSPTRYVRVIKMLDTAILVFVDLRDWLRLPLLLEVMVRCCAHVPSKSDAVLIPLADDHAASSSYESIQPLR